MQYCEHAEKKHVEQKIIHSVEVIELEIKDKENWTEIFAGIHAQKKVINLLL